MYAFIEARPIQKEKFGRVEVEITDFQYFQTAKAAREFIASMIDGMPDYHTCEVWKIEPDGNKLVYRWQYSSVHIDYLSGLANNETNN